MIRKLLGLDWLARKLGYVEQDVRIARRDLCDLVGRVQELEERADAGALPTSRRTVAIPRPNVVEPRPEPLRVPVADPMPMSSAVLAELQQRTHAAQGGRHVYSDTLLPVLECVEPQSIPVKPHCVAPALVQCSCKGECRWLDLCSPACGSTCPQCEGKYEALRDQAVRS